MDELVGGRYRLLDRIGSGGMAEVWRAQDSHTGAVVALKRLHAEALGDPAARERFAREIDALRAIDHPLAIPVLDADVDDGEAWLVMELVPGGSLRDRLTRGPVPEAEAARLGADVASILDAAHEAGLVHRDVTPANILLDDRGRARLVDFGVAAVPADWGRDAVTATTDVVGTLRFIAPEVLEGAPATAASDVWGLGVVLWEAIAGHPPFEAGSPAALLAAQQSPAPPLGGDPVLASLVASTLARDVSDRPSAAVVAAGLRQAAADLEAAERDVTVTMAIPIAAVPASSAVDDGAGEPAAAGSATPAAIGTPSTGTRTPSAGWAALAAAPPAARQTTDRRIPAVLGAAVLGLALVIAVVAASSGLGIPSAAPGDATPAPSQAADPVQTNAPAEEEAPPSVEEVAGGPRAGRGNDKADKPKPGKGKGRGHGNGG